MHTRTPALDGLRGIAILCVLLGHLGLPLFGGSLIMFVLSGYLITSIMLREYDRSGTINRARFYQKRFLRLIPALGVMLVTINIIVVFWRPAEATGLRFDTLYTLLYASNWSQVWNAWQSLYLLHLWSLSIEEQFYLAFPWVMLILCRRSRRGMIAAFLVVACASWGGRALLVIDGAPLGVIYASTFTRLDGLMVGCALAAGMHGTKQGQRYPRLNACLLISGVIAGSAALYGFNAYNPVTYLVGMPLVFGCTALVIRGAVQGQNNPVIRALSAWPARHLGQISYGVYLWHWPLLMLLHETPLLAACLGLMAGQLSYTLIEAPIKKWHMSSINQTGFCETGLL